MTVADLAIVYAIIGVGCAAARLGWRGRRQQRLSDAALLAAVWPLYLPMLALSEGDEPERDVFARRVAIARARLADIDRVLAQPGFDLGAATARIDELRDRGDAGTALSTATARADNIRRLQALRDRYARELDDVDELLAQLETQRELIRLAGEPQASTADLASELTARIEALDEVWSP